MAIIQSPLIGRARRSIGGVTFCTWKGLNIAKTKILNPKPQPLSEAVILNRTKMALAGQCCGFINSFVKHIWYLGTTKTTAFAELVKFFRMKLTGSVGSLVLDDALLSGSKFGSENTGTINYAATAAAARHVLCTLDAAMSNPLLQNDTTLVSFIVCNNTFNRIVYFADVCDGNATSYSIPLAEYFSIGDRVFVWAQGIKIESGADLVSPMFACCDGFITLTV